MKAGKKLARMTVEVPATIKNQFFAHCTLQGLTMTTVVRDLLADYIKANPKAVLKKMMKEMK